MPPLTYHDVSTSTACLTLLRPCMNLKRRALLGADKPCTKRRTLQLPNRRILMNMSADSKEILQLVSMSKQDFSKFWQILVGRSQLCRQLTCLSMILVWHKNDCNRKSLTLQVCSSGTNYGRAETKILMATPSAHTGYRPH